MDEYLDDTVQRVIHFNVPAADIQTNLRLVPTSTISSWSMRRIGGFS
jgi:hypothetical protein